MTEIKINVTVNGEVDVQKIAEQIRQQIEKATKTAPKYKVGGYARLKSLNDPLHGFKVGQIVKLHDNTGSASDFKVTPIDGSRVGYSDVKNFEPVTDEELAEIERKEAEKAVAAKWASINRKPNEFKAGDAIRYKKAFTTVNDVKTDGTIVIEQGNGWTLEVTAESLTLVFPAEAKFE